MKIDVQAIDRQNFLVQDRFISDGIGDVPVLLVGPNRDNSTKWHPHTKIFRSSVWTPDGELISAGLPKFENLGVNPEVFPQPEGLVGSTAVLKVDGSCLIVSKWKGRMIYRTRGTVDATVFTVKDDPVGNEVIPLVKRYGIDDLDPRFSTWARSLIFEWVTPRNKIVVPYPEPDLFLIGCVNHDDYSLVTQRELDDIADSICVKRPPEHHFDSVDHMVETIRSLKGEEGVCLYYHDDQRVVKVKSDWWKTANAFKTNYNIESVLDFYIAQGEPTFQKFQDFITKTFNNDCFEISRGLCSNVVDAKKEVDQIVNGISGFVDKIKTFSSRKDQANAIISSYGATARQSFCFSILDGKPITNEGRKKLFFQVLKHHEK